MTKSCKPYLKIDFKRESRHKSSEEEFLVCLTQDWANVTIVRSSWLGDRGLSLQIEESPHSIEHGAG